MFKKLMFVFKSVAVSILLIPAFTGNVNAQGKAGWQAAITEITGEADLPQTLILSATGECATDCSAGTDVNITIFGENFLAVSAVDPTVTLEGLGIDLDAGTTGTDITATVSATDYPPGDYLLTVTRDGEDSVRRTDTFNLTVNHAVPVIPAAVAPAISGHIIRSSTFDIGTVAFDTGGVTRTRLCAGGEKVLGGGAKKNGGAPGTGLRSSFPVSQGWRVNYDCIDAGGNCHALNFTVFAICATFSP